MEHFFEQVVHAGHQGWSFLNGAIGDKIADTPLGIEAGFYYQRQRLVLQKAYLRDRYSRAFAITPKICILIHGLTHNETAWDFDDRSNYGTKLAEDLGYTPFYFRYNTGLHISENGKKINTLIAKLYQNYPIQIRQIAIIGHSMGGLLAHSAAHYALEQRQAWIQHLQKVCLIAAPHLGSFLERFANLTTGILTRIPNWPTQLVGKAINLRSHGIKDLRFGYLRDEDWQGHPPDRLWHNTRTPIRIPEHTRYHIITGSLSPQEQHWINIFLGDLLVSTRSASADYDTKSGIRFDPHNYRHFPGANHFKLLTMEEVYQQIKDWF
ncbi:MAG: esterase/lipase family protein [Bernardetiaceae bacterium]